MYKFILSCLLPYTCLLCRVSTQRRLDLCLDCERALPWLGAYVCMRCAVPLPEFEFGSDALRYCGACLNKIPPFYQISSLFSYAPPISKLIIELKFHNRLVCARVLSELLIVSLKQIYQAQSLPELIIPVPLHTKRLSQRGFNQALELARPIAAYFKLPIDSKNCIRIRDTKAQTALSQKERNANVKGAFYLKKTPLLAKHVALIDDVVTTGCTVNEISGLLRTSGVERVDIWCCARTLI